MPEKPEIVSTCSENRVEHWQRHSVVASLCRSMIGDEEQGGSGGSEEVEEEEEDEERERERNRGQIEVSWGSLRNL